ncbi:MAG: transcriptional repressor LexA [Actinomycetota bacterium]
MSPSSTSPAATAAPTARQRRILDFIARTVRERGYPPTVREIGEAVGLTSSSSVHAQLENLERLGLLRRDPTKPRAIGLAEVEASGPRSPEGTVPLLGRIAAGSPILATENVEDHLRVPQGYADGGEHFALRVAGDSMIGAGILDGDVVVVRRQDDARDGDIVAALLPGPAEDEATVKRLRRDQGRVMLVPENPALAPFEMRDGRIVGTVTAVLRKL